jgi:hypothetical protein
MKNNTVRVHRNGATKPASTQTKTSRRAVRKKSGPANKSVALILVSEEDDSTISPGIDLTAAEFAAIQKDCATRGESLDAWLVRTFGETPALRSLQSAGEQKSSPAVPATAAPETVIPARVALAAEDAISIMEITGHAASAFLILSADEINSSAKGFAGWEALDIANFGAGVLELARGVVSDFYSSLDIFAGDLRKLISNKKMDAPAQQLEDAPEIVFENAVGALRHCVLMMSMCLSNKSKGQENQIAHHVGFAMNDKLEKAFNELWAARKSVLQEVAS